MTSFKDRARGCLVGLAIRDALGAQMEEWVDVARQNFTNSR